MKSSTFNAYGHIKTFMDSIFQYYYKVFDKFCQLLVSVDREFVLATVSRVVLAPFDIYPKPITVFDSFKTVQIYLFPKVNVKTCDVTSESEIKENVLKKYYFCMT